MLAATADKQIKERQQKIIAGSVRAAAEPVATRRKIV
jgi:hypothetical protein